MIRFAAKSLPFILLFFFSNQFLFSQENNLKIGLENIIGASKDKFAPDKRVAIWEIGVEVKTGDTCVVRGKTNIPIAKKTSLEQIKKDFPTLVCLDSIQLLPAADLGENTLAVVATSVANMRSKPGHASELAMQALLGAPLKVLEKEGSDWYRVQAEDGYISWVDHGGIVLMNKETFQKWTNAPKVIFTQESGFIYESTNGNRKQIAEVTLGAMLNIDSLGALNESWIKVTLPNGKSGLQQTNEVKLYKEWLAQRKYDNIDAITIAEKYLGKPYLWGGTSVKGVDCSGLTKLVYYEMGYQIPRDASQQVQCGDEITINADWSSLKKGDLLFFGQKATPDKKEKVTHVAISAGSGRFIHAASGSVRYESINPLHSDFNADRAATFLRAKRIVGVEKPKNVRLLKP